MLKFFREGIEYNRLAKSINALYIVLNDLEKKIHELDYEELEPHIVPLIYAVRVDIWDRIQKNHWDLNNLIIVPAISKNKIPIVLALNKTVDRLINFSDEFGFEKIYQDFMLKGKAFYEFHNSMPDDIRRGFNR